MALDMTTILTTTPAVPATPEKRRFADAAFDRSYTPAEFLQVVRAVCKDDNTFHLNSAVSKVDASSRQRAPASSLFSITAGRFRDRQDYFVDPSVYALEFLFGFNSGDGRWNHLGVSRSGSLVGAETTPSDVAMIACEYLHRGDTVETPWPSVPTHLLHHILYAFEGVACNYRIFNINSKAKAALNEISKVSRNIKDDVYCSRDEALAVVDSALAAIRTEDLPEPDTVKNRIDAVLAESEWPFVKRTGVTTDLAFETTAPAFDPESVLVDYENARLRFQKGDADHEAVAVFGAAKAAYEKLTGALDARAPGLVRFLTEAKIARETYNLADRFK